MLIPNISDRLKLLQDWNLLFGGHNQHHLSDLYRAITGKSPWSGASLEVSSIVLPAETVLIVHSYQISRGYHREGNRIKFHIADCPDKRFAPKKMGGTAKGGITFEPSLRDMEAVEMCLVEG